MLVYSPTIGPRLRYVLQFLGETLQGKPLSFTTNAQEALRYDGVLINYSATKLREIEIWIAPQGLLDETGIREVEIIVKNKENGIPFFFETSGDYPFDIFSAIFYLLSRYEEYLPHEKDSYGRYAHTNSLAWREGFLHRPIVNKWINEFNSHINHRQAPNHLRGIHTSPDIHHRPSTIYHPPSTIPQLPSALPFTFLPTYDIDIAFSYKHKGFWRNMVGGVAALFTLKWKSLGERVSVCLGKKRDPFDVFGWLNGLHERLGLKPYYFFLVAPKRGKYDKNINPALPAMRQLVHDHAIRYPVGVHPSWRSGDEPAQLETEIRLLADAAGTEVQASRQHYIRISFPTTYRQLLASGIRFDFSMGYGSINGFRASVALPFYWYDLEKEETTQLLVFPFCYMEANSFFEQKQNAEEGLAEMRRYYDVVKNTGGLFCMIWHNSFLTETAIWAEWRKGYEKFLVSLSK
ncbi:MAG: polysaccharide deacetylase family protein [Chitinophagaceae bacterium]|nr:polysaccharide deacetylase family protein [Chitinophagaceae bacterium]